MLRSDFNSKNPDEFWCSLLQAYSHRRHVISDIPALALQQKFTSAQ